MSYKNKLLNEISKEKSSDNIITKRLFLRKFSEGDIEEFYKIAMKNEVGKWLGIGKGMSFLEAKKYVNNIINHWIIHNFGVWAVINRENEQFMGHCGLRYIDDTEDIEIIYLLDPKFWGKGYATEAGNGVIQYAFNYLRVDKLQARVRTGNVKSKKVIDKLGFEYTGDREYAGRTLSFYKMDIVSYFSME